MPAKLDHTATNKIVTFKASVVPVKNSQPSSSPEEEALAFRKSCRDFLRPFLGDIRLLALAVSDEGIFLEFQTASGAQTALERLASRQIPAQQIRQWTAVVEYYNQEICWDVIRQLQDRPAISVH